LLIVREMDSSRNIFWGLVVKPGKRYETEVQEPFRITKACLEPATATSKTSSVFVECDNNEEFIIANLNAKNINETIDLSFNEGEKICFKVDGPGTVHMTGNLLDDPPPDGMLGGDWSEEESSEESEEETMETSGDKIREVSGKEAKKILKRKSEETKEGKKAKKAKVEDGDSTVDTSLGDLDDTENYAEENESEDDSDEESDSNEENTTVGDTTAEMADTTAASDDDDDSSEEESDEEPLKKSPSKKVESPMKKKTEKSKVSVNGDNKTPKEKKDDTTGTEVQKMKTKVKENKTAQQVETIAASDEDENDSSEEESDETSPRKKVESPTKKKTDESKLSVNENIEKKDDTAGTEAPKMKTNVEENKTPKQVERTAASDDDEDPSEEESDEEPPKMSPPKTVDSPTMKETGDVKTSKEKNDDTTGTETPKIKTKVKEKKTPKQVETEEKFVKTPKAELKTPKQSKTSKEENLTTPKEVTKTPKTDVKTPREDAKTPKQEVKTPKASQTPGKTPKRTLKGGVQVEDLKEGSGQECKPGNMIGMYYEGRLKDNNKKFDGVQSGKPFKFKLGAGQVIKGWDVGVLGMKVGGKRRLTIPAKLGYGAQGSPPVIPGNSTLVFDIECKSVK